MEAGALELVIGHPVDLGGGALHQHKGLSPLEGAHQRMVEGGLRRHGVQGLLIVPAGVGVPGDNVDFLGDFVVIQAAEQPHKVGCHRQAGGVLLKGLCFIADKVRGVGGGKAPPVQQHPQDRMLPLVHGRVDLVKGIKGMAPEAGPPGVVELADVVVIPFPQPVLEFFPAEVAAAGPAELVGDVPENHAGMLAVPLGQAGVHLPHLLAVNRGGDAVVVASSVEVALSGGEDPADLRVFFIHPGGSGPGGGCQDGIDAVLIEAVDGLVHPVKGIYALLRFQGGPGKDAQGDAVDAGFFHQLDILFQDIGAVQPLIGVIVPAVEQAVKLGKKWGIRGSHHKTFFHIK